MLGNKILQQNPPLNNKINKGEIRHRIKFLRVTFGDILNLWPKYAQDEFYQLSRQLRQIEGVK